MNDNINSYTGIANNKDKSEEKINSENNINTLKEFDDILQKITIC